ncbi:MAG TPA: DUF2961 domain-containing protein [Candidatus Hydrogenedens sp.]|nr:DUF2961 domain-containing protein [Candidatus Hydrogenedens sp.]HOL18963.1 DUF2961 domain-containing protein [Candidatus Hydrogenedens sp.]HPP58985.1 DUF2961 domain-containing protein [Candidatus Hydrogenedens sp.]
MKKTTMLMLMFIFLGGVFANANSVITTTHLISELTDLFELVEYPETEYKLIQFSSYDRRSVQRLHKDWFSNSDGFGSEPIPGFVSVLKEESNDADGEYLLALIDGPGAIVRFWTAAIKGSIRLYLDDMEKPLYEGSAEEFFRHPYSPFINNTKITEELLNGSLYQRDSAYCPMPFSKGCKIVWIGKRKDIHFYHLMVRKYPEGTVVQTFSPSDLKMNEDMIIKVATTLKDPTKLLTGETLQKTDFQKELLSNQNEVLWNDKKTGAVVGLKLRVKDITSVQTYRELLLRIYADGIKEPLVDSPLIDYFAVSPGINPYQSLPLEVTADGWLISRFPMPFQTEMTITLQNVTDKSITVEGEVITIPYEWDSQRSMYFLARWRGEDKLWIQSNCPYDLPFLYAKGKGFLVGAVSHVFNPSNVPTSGGNWWGEGDEKIFVDNDPLPSIFGTGSEDFYNYSWSATDIFYYPYCGQPRNDGPGNRGFVSNYRWLILDRVPFKEYIAFSLELLIHTEVHNLGYARIAYYYARPETTDDHSPIPHNVYNPLDTQDNWSWLPEPKGAAHNAIYYQAEDCLLSTDNTELINSYLWAGRGLCVWKPRQINDTLTFKLHVPEEKNYDIRLVCAYTPKSGSFTVQWDDKILSDKQTSLYDEHHTVSRELNFGKQHISAGDHTLTLTFAGPENKEVSIDFIWLQPVK